MSREFDEVNYLENQVEIESEGKGRKLKEETIGKKHVRLSQRRKETKEQRMARYQAIVDEFNRDAEPEGS